MSLYWQMNRLWLKNPNLTLRWSYVGKKTNPRWLWHAIDRKTGQVVAYVFGRRKDEVFLQLKTLLEPFGIKRYCTDGWGAYERHLPVELHQVGKQNTQRIERKHLSLRTRIKRLVRKTICFSKTELMHDKRDWTIYKSLRVRVINLIENNKSKTLPLLEMQIVSQYDYRDDQILWHFHRYLGHQNRCHQLLQFVNHLETLNHVSPVAIGRTN